MKERKHYNAEITGGASTVFFNILYSLILFFTLFPVVWSPRIFNGFGQYGYGIRQQKGRFEALMKADMSRSLMLLIGAIVILLIIAVIIAVCFCIAALFYLNSSKKKGTNIRLLKVFNLFIAGSMVFVFAVTVLYLTFTFICAFTAVFYMMLITFKPDFVDDFVKRRGNENRNGAAVMMIMLSIVFALCFSPIYNFRDASYVLTSYDFYNIAFDFKQQEYMFLSVISACILIVITVVYLYVFIQYLRGKKIYLITAIIALCISFVLAVPIGANILVESKFGNTSTSYSLRSNYYILISTMLIVITVYLIQKATDIRHSKK